MSKTRSFSRSLPVSGLLCLALLAAPLRAQQASTSGDIFGAIHVNDIALVQKFIDENPSAAKTPTSKGISPLHYAAKLGRLEAAHVLISAGADVNAAVTGSNTTPLHWAADSDNVDIVRLLLKRGANPKAVARNGYTPLHFAARGNHAKAVEALIAAGSDVNALDREYRTPLHVAAAENATDAVRALLAAGANTALMDRTGQTARDMANETTAAAFDAAPAPAPAAQPAPAPAPAAQRASTPAISPRPIRTRPHSFAKSMPRITAEFAASALKSGPANQSLDWRNPFALQFSCTSFHTPS